MPKIYHIKGLPFTIEVGDDGSVIAIAGQGEVSRASVFVEIDEGSVEAHVWDERAETALALPVTIPLIQSS